MSDIDELFIKASDLPLTERQAFLESLDHEQRAQLNALLVADDTVG